VFFCRRTLPSSSVCSKRFRGALFPNIYCVQTRSQLAELHPSTRVKAPEHSVLSHPLSESYNNGLSTVFRSRSQSHALNLALHHRSIFLPRSCIQFRSLCFLGPVLPDSSRRHKHCFGILRLEDDKGRILRGSVPQPRVPIVTVLPNPAFPLVYHCDTGGGIFGMEASSLRYFVKSTA